MRSTPRSPGLCPVVLVVWISAVGCSLTTPLDEYTAGPYGRDASVLGGRGGTAGKGGAPAGGGSGGGVDSSAGGAGGQGGGAPGGAGGTGGTGGAAAGNGGSGGDECDQCAQSQCGTEIDACGQLTECMTLHQCLVDCKNDTCWSACASSHTAGWDFWIAMQACTTVKCHTPCLQSKCAWGFTNATCTACVNDKCASTCHSCDFNLGCTSYVACLMFCTDQACQTACASKYPEGPSLWDAMIGTNGCLKTQCATQC